MVDKRKPTREDTDVIGKRVGAQIIDLIITFAINMVLIIGFFLTGFAASASTANQNIGSIIMGVGMVISVFVTFTYGFLLEAFWNGQTLGKKALGIRVLQSNGSPVTKLGAFIRNIPGFLSLVWYITWLTHLIGLISISASDDRQRLFDMLANTLVVDES